MRRVMLLALLAVALPMAVSADQVRYNTGTQGFPPTATGTFSDDFPTDFTAMVDCPTCAPVVGAVDGNTTITFSTMSLDCSSNPPFCTFGTGEVMVEKGSTLLFMSAVQFGANTNILLLPDQFVMSAAELVAPFSDPLAVGGSLGMGLQFSSESDGVLNNLGGNAAVIVDRVIPEPGTLWQLATGLIGLGGIAIRKLRLGP